MLKYSEYKKRMIKMEKYLKKTWVVAVLCTVCCMLWGSAIPMIKLGYAEMQIEDTDVMAQILSAGIRFFIAGVLTVIIGSISSRRFIYPTSLSSAFRVVKLSCLQTIIQYVFFYIALANIDGVKASILDGVSVFIALFVSALVFRMEKLTAVKVAGSIVGFIGVFLININTQSVGSFFEFSLFGEGFIILSTIGYACSSVFIKRYSVYDDTTMLSGWQFMFGGAVMVVIGLIFGGRLKVFSLKAALIILYLAFVSAVAYTIWARLLKYNPVSKVAVFGFLTPILGSVFSMLILGETSILSLKGVASLLLVSVGIVLVNQKAKAKH